MNMDKRMSGRVLAAPLLGGLLVACGGSTGIAAEEFATGGGELRGEVLHQGLNHPWAIAFLPDGGALISERPGQLRYFPDAENFEGRGDLVSGLPDDLVAQNQGGLLDLVLHPEFEDNRWLYFTYAGQAEGGQTTRLARGQFADGVLEEVEILFSAEPVARGGRHLGSRIVFDADGYVYVSVGDRGDQDRAQKKDDHAGSIVRLYDDGSVPDDNPFVGEQGAHPEIWVTGVRNPQGMVIDPETGIFWQNEHGPRGGDEVNIIERGLNYGWPVISHGGAYSGGPIGSGESEKEGMESALHYWTPAIAPSGMAILRDPAFADWDGDLLVGGLRGQTLRKLTFGDRELVEEVDLLPDLGRRIRDVRVHDGAIYVLTDHNPGELIRLTPTD